ncbi:MAG: response regulator [Kiritimatiellia bacterium]
MVRVVVVDDHAVVRLGLRFVLGNKRDGLEFAGEWPGGEGAAAFVQKTDPDIVLLDIRMPDKDGLVVLKEILAIRPRQKVIMLTTSDADNDVYTALTLGAKGYLLKDRDATEIVNAINRVMQGGRFVPEAVMALFRKRQMMPDLTPRECEVIRHLRDGLTNEAIAARMGVTKDAIKLHLRNIFNKLDVNDRVSVVREVLARGFLR